LVIGVGVLVIATAGLLMRDRIGDRIDETRTELREIGEGKLDSMTGVRVMMGQRAIDAGLAHPIGGVGAGGFESWANLESEENRAHAHAHNSVLQIWSTTGLIGIVLWAGLLVTMLRGAWRIWDVENEGIYGLAPMFAIIGLGFGSITDSVHLSTQTAAMLGALAALSPAYRPGHPRWKTDERRS
jgi:O-antigen ligase